VPGETAPTAADARGGTSTREPTTRDEVGGVLVARSSERACHLPLHDEIGAHRACGRVVEESVEDRRRATERRVGQHPERGGGEREVGEIAREDRDAGRSGETLRETGGERRVDFHRTHARAAVA